MSMVFESLVCSQTAGNSKRHTEKPIHRPAEFPALDAQ